MPASRRRNATGTVLASVAAASALLAMTAAGPAEAAGSPGRAAPRSWTVYHGDPAGTGVARGVRSVNVRGRAWTSPTLDGQIYGQPLALGHRVYVATENNTVYALSA